MAGERAALERIDDVRRELRYRLAEPQRWHGPVRRMLAARAIQGSNTIEGYDVSVEDAVAAVAGDTPSDDTTEDWLAVRSYQRAMTYVLQLADDPQFEYSTELLRSLHFMMTEYDIPGSSPGRWRTGSVWVHDDATDELVYEAPDAELAPRLVESLIEALGDGDEGPAMIRAAMAHLNLAMIHPFRDGNGRMARCLQTMVLAREGILPPEVASIEEYLGRNTAAYYEVLAEVGEAQWSPGNDARPWVRFCLRAHYVQGASVLRRAHEAEALWVHLERRATDSGLPERAIEALFDASRGLRVRNSSYRLAVERSGAPITKETATRDLRAMVEARLLVQQGAKRGASYVGADSLVDFVREQRATRAPIGTDRLFDPSDVEPTRSE